MTPPVILPAQHPLPHEHEIEFPAWCADKLREAWWLGPIDDFEIQRGQQVVLLMKALIREPAPAQSHPPEDIWEPGPPCAACGQTTCDHPDPVFAVIIPPPPTTPRVAGPNYAALGLGSADEAEGRN